MLEPRQVLTFIESTFPPSDFDNNRMVDREVNFSLSFNIPEMYRVTSPFRPAIQPQIFLDPWLCMHGT